MAIPAEIEKYNEDIYQRDYGTAVMWFILAVFIFVVFAVFGVYIFMFQERFNLKIHNFA
jgi:hypothetical protein